MIKIGFTGTRAGMTKIQKEMLREVLKRYTIKEVHHGDCVGADAEFHTIACELGARIIIHPPTNPSARAWCRGDITVATRDYIDRNHDIADICDVTIVCPKESTMVQRSGTWATYRYAKKVGKTTMIIWPDGAMTEDRRYR